MMFQSGNLKTPAAVKPIAKPSAAGPQTGVRAVAAPVAGLDAAAATLMFGPPATASVPPPAAPVAPPVAAAEPVPVKAPEAAPVPAAPGTGASDGARAEPHLGEPSSEAAPVDSSAPATMPPDPTAVVAPEASAATPGRFDRAPPRALLLGVGALLAAALIALLVAVAVKKLGSHPPSAAAVEAVGSAEALAAQDSLPAISDAATRIREALAGAGSKARWPEGKAALASVEVQWADALTDEAALWSDRANRAAQAGDEARRAEADGRAQKAQDEARTHLKTAFELASPAAKAEPKSADLALALADYYRAQRSPSNLNRELRRAQALHADDGRVQLIQGAALAQDEDSADRAIPKLKAALAGDAANARVHFRLAMAYVALKDEANARSELQETLRLSPRHERAKMVLEQLAPRPR